MNDDNIHTGKGDFGIDASANVIQEGGRIHLSREMLAAMATGGLGGEGGGGAAGGGRVEHKSK